jgi:hypothetical protein
MEEKPEGGKNASYYHEATSRIWCPFWTSDPPLEPEDETIHFRGTQWNLHH